MSDGEAFMTDAADLSKMIPGFEFLQDMARNSAATLPGLGQWVAPTLDPDEIGRRIDELRTVQFWLEQNARMLGTTIQALEVQRMTLSALKTMNVQAADLAEAFKIRRPQTPDPAAAAAAPPVPPQGAAKDAAQGAASARTGKSRKAAAAADANPAQAAPPAASPAPGMADPVQWWNALTQQFTQIATTAMKDGSVDSAAQMASTLVRNSADAMGQALQAARVPPEAAAARPSAAPAPSARKSAPRKTRAKPAARGPR
jgi:hypothetical protein